MLFGIGVDDVPVGLPEDRPAMGAVRAPGPAVVPPERSPGRCSSVERSAGGPTSCRKNSLERLSN
jgi:hypothetical protein